MVTKRARVSEAVATEIFTQCRRRCCLCFGFDNDETEKDGQLAHIDRDSSNSSAGNLVYLCLDHHNKYDTVYRQTKRLTASEVKFYKRLLVQKYEDSGDVWELVLSGTVKSVTDPGLAEIVDKLGDVLGDFEIHQRRVRSGSVIIELWSRTSTYQSARENFEASKMRLSEQLGCEVLNVKPSVLDTDTLLKECSKLLDAGRYEEAISAVNLVIEYDIDNPEAWAEKSAALAEYHHCFCDEGDTEFLHHANACIERAISLAPKNAMFLSQQASILHPLGDNEAALSAIEMAERLAPNNGFVLFNKGVILCNTGDFGSGIEALKASHEAGYEKAKSVLHDAYVNARRQR